MRVRGLFLSVVLAGAGLAGAAFAATSAETVALARTTLSAVTAAPANRDAVMDAINGATQGVELDVITAALCQLQQRRDLDDIVGRDPNALAQAQATLNREEVADALGDACEVARLALASYGATGGVPAGAAPGQAFGSGAVGAPGGGGGSGYTD